MPEKRRKPEATPKPGAGPDVSGSGWVCLGAISGVFGVRGEVRIKPFTEDPAAIGQYGPVTLSPVPVSGPAVVKIKAVKAARGGLIARFSGIDDRNAAEALKGIRLYVPRSALPVLDDEDDFYHDDLIGLRAENEDGDLVGEVRAVHDFGAGDLLEVKPADGPAFMVRFTREDVPVVDVAGGRVVVRVPESEPEAESEQDRQPGADPQD